MDELICAEKEGLRRWRGAQLRALLATGRDTSNASPADGMAALLGGFLAQVIIEQNDRPQEHLRMTPMMQSSREGAEILAAWDAAIGSALAACKA
jgi:hypothetical protein